ncbi:hypothetical protein MPRG_24980 [Mycobacterium paragordonae]|uniref:Uncharacterized protein n=1 Tax=Mycobacterium paragordonae TaxID=1389713 RepID=A0ABQ1C4J1_9MYCO|nr:hypothetical protein MPRG_24980 [Mycobacterium paragordonae]
MQNSEGGALGTDVPVAPDVVAIAANAGDSAVLDLNHQAAHGFTQRAGMQVAAVYGAGHSITVLRYCWYQKGYKGL